MTYYLLGMRLNSTSYEAAARQIIAWAKDSQSRTVCAADMHMVMESYDHESVRVAVNSADLITSDGMPLVWWLRLKGVRNQQRVYGPSLMLHICQAAAGEGIPVGLFGSTPAVLAELEQRLKKRFPGLNITFVHSPPFRPLTAEEDAELVRQIQAAGVRILFVGLGCPKQERWTADHRGQIPAVMVAVGAAFQFHAGEVPQAPLWMQRCGLEWFHRLLQEPGRLWKRYLINIPRFLVLVSAEAMGILHIESRSSSRD